MAEAAEDIFAGLKASAGNGAPLYLQLKKSIEDAVRRGVIGPGDALPSERDIAVRAEMSRVTVRKAVQDLVRGGILVQRHGSGTFVAQRVEQGGMVELDRLRYGGAAVDDAGRLAGAAHAAACSAALRRPGKRGEFDMHGAAPDVCGLPEWRLPSRRYRPVVCGWRHPRGVRGKP